MTRSLSVRRKHGQHDWLQLRQHHACCCWPKLYNHWHRARVSVPHWSLFVIALLSCSCSAVAGSHRLPLTALFVFRYDAVASVSSSRFIGCNSTCLGEFCASQSSGIASLASDSNSSLSVNGTSFDHMLIACDGGPGGYCSSQGGAVFAVVSEQGQTQNFIIQIQASSVIGSFCTA